MKMTTLFKTPAITLTVLALLGLPGLQAADVSEYGVLKGKQYIQTDATTPPDSEWSMYWLSAYARMTATDSVTEATVQPPGGEALPLYIINDPLMLQLDIPGGFTLPEMNTTFPNGTYELTLTTAHDGNKSLSLSLTGDSYPNTPTFLNFASLEAVDASAPYTVSWSALAGGTATDYIQVRVVDTDDNVVFITPMAGVAGALNGAATSVVIPANTLSPESNYTVRLLFVKVTTRNTTGYPGLTGLGGYYKYTDAALATTVGGGADNTPPQLVASTPANGAANVSVSMPIVFVFNEPMANAESIAWSANVIADDFSYDWSGDGLTLTCYYMTMLPEKATITWTLNPASQPLDFADVAGNALPANTYSGSFTTAGGTSTNCYGGEDDGRGTGSVSKEVNYVQTSSAAPTPHPTRAATFLSSVTSPTNNPVTGAKVQVPGGPLLILTNFMGMGLSFLNSELYASQTALDTARPGGNYNLQLTRSSGSPSANVSLSGTYPNTPQIMNYDAAQAINPAADFVLQWNGFTGASGTDSVSVSLINPVTFWIWTAPDPCVPRALANTATSVTIPAGTLQGGTTYDCTLAYTRFPYSSTNAIADMQLLSMLQKSVSFTIKTTGGSGGDGARFIGYKVLPGGKLELKFQGGVGETYLIEASDDLLSNWIVVTTQVIPPGGIATFQVSVGTQPSFFRAFK
jgi:hypothetical protein